MSVHKLSVDLRTRIVEYNMMSAAACSAAEADELQPNTWREIADTAEKILKVRLDIPSHRRDKIRNIKEPEKPKSAQGENLNSLSASTCGKCGGVGHTKACCINTLTISEKRYDAIKAAQEAEGRRCETCGGIGHTSRDHIKWMKQQSSPPPPSDPHTEPRTKRTEDRSPSKADRGGKGKGGGKGRDR